MYTPLPVSRMAVGLPWGIAMPSRNVVMVKGEELEVMVVKMELIWR